MTKTFTQIQKAKVQLIVHHPFYAQLLHRLKIISDPTIKTARTDGAHLWINFKWFDALTLSEALFVLAHEVMHCVEGHPFRTGSRHPKKFNVAADYQINAKLKNDGTGKMPDCGLYDPQYSGMSAEAIYEKLPDGDHGGQGGDPGGCGGFVSPSESATADKKDPDQLKDEWKTAVVAAASSAKLAGKLPGGVRDMVEKITDPKADWRELLRRFMDETTEKTDRSWNRPNRRHIHNGLYLPGPAPGLETGDIVVGVDTSGSITDKVLAAFGSELRAIVEEGNPKSVTVIYCSHDISRVDVFENGDPVNIATNVETGGTDFRPVFEEIKRRKLEPSCVVYLTDLYGPAPEAEEWPTIWACTEASGEGPWGQTVHIDVHSG